MAIRSWIPLLVVACVTGALRAAPPDDAAGIEFFEAKIRPIFAGHCYQCHSGGAKKLKGGLRLDVREFAFAGGDTGRVLVPGQPEQSRLIEAINYGNPDLQMPPKAKLADAEIAVLTTWIKSGAPWPKDAASPTTGPAAPVFDLARRRAEQWAWQPIRPESPPDVNETGWARGSIDRFILAALEARGLKPAGPADKRALVRRAYFDLIGLPPTPANVEDFVRDDSPEAFARVVDRLLADPRFGERWARHWMDLVRYAETYGHEFDYPIEHAWRYRDYLIRAFNADVPYDRFVSEHVAGDLLPTPRLDPATGCDESIIATGSWFLGEQVHAPVDVRQHQADFIDNQIDVFGKTFLGLTLACARCHDHKFDPIRQKDYYALYGILEGTDRQEIPLDPGGRIAAIVKRMAAERDGAGRRLAAGAAESSSCAGQTFGQYLLAARDARGDTGRIERAKKADGSGMNGDRLARWVAALGEKATREPSHPMFAWSHLADSRTPFEAKRDELRKQYRAAVEAARTTRAKTVLFKNFSEGGYKDWHLTGWAFGDGPTRAGQWDPASTTPRVLPAGIAHGGAPSGRLVGTLRSPSFVLEKPQLLYHAAGRGGRIRLVIDNYRMDQFNGLLFSGAILEVNTGGAFAWIRQAGDVGRYVGHRAHVEISDDGSGGWAAVDEVRFADADAPVPAGRPDPMAGEFLEQPNVDTAESLAAAYARAWDRALVHWRDGSIDAAECDLLNWAFDHRLMELPGPLADKLKAALARLDELAHELPEPMWVIGAGDSNAVDERVFLRGSPKTLGPVAPRQFLEAVAGPDQPAMGAGSGRLELARRMLDPSDPLLPRVIVNRLWHHLLGRGIVASTDNLGVMGSTPTHPRLLDYLADHFVHDGWSIKRTIRAIMLSSTYQMSSRASDARTEQIDPLNALLHRANLRRLEAEPVRDEILAVSGRLDGTMFGPPVEVHLTEFMQGRGRPASGPLDGAGRRSIYLAVRRNFMSPMLLAFDFPTPFSSMGRRTVSNVPAQALTLMNDPFVTDQARTWAAGVLADKTLASPRQRIERMYLQAFARPPSAAELEQTADFLRAQSDQLGIPSSAASDDPRVWSELAHALMNAKEFVFLK